MQALHKQVPSPLLPEAAGEKPPSPEEFQCPALLGLTGQVQLPSLSPAQSFAESERDRAPAGPHFEFSLRSPAHALQDIVCLLRNHGFKFKRFYFNSKRHATFFRHCCLKSPDHVPFGGRSRWNQHRYEVLKRVGRRRGGRGGPRATVVWTLWVYFSPSQGPACGRSTASVTAPSPGTDKEQACPSLLLCHLVPNYRPRASLSESEDVSSL